LQILVPIESAYRICNFLLVLHSNFCPVLHHFRDMATYWLIGSNSTTPPLPLLYYNKSNSRYTHHKKGQYKDKK